MSQTNGLPLVSVIITTYNYANFLPRAVESVLNQTYRNYEIIIVDDGSTDNTKSTVSQSWRAKYFYQENKALAAARNAAIIKSAGKYLVFLDADDWLEADALEQNYRVIKNMPGIAFVSGNHFFLLAETNKLHRVSVSVKNGHYARFLQSNYIGMHAAVMFQRWVFDEFHYDENLRACEDYDLYLNIARKYPVFHHDKFIATYYFHSAGLSHRYNLMMDSVYSVIKKQAPYVKTMAEKKAYDEGLEQWRDYYSLAQKVV